MCRAGPASAVPLSAGFFSELLLRDDLARPGQVIEISSRPWPSGRRRRPRRRPAPRGFPRPGHGGGRSHWPGRHTVAGSQICSGCPALAGRDAAGLPGIRSPGTVTTARSAASSIRSRRSISSPMCRTSDASSAVLRGWIRAQNAARLRMSVRRLLIAARVATWGIPRHLSASRRPSGQAGPAGSPASSTGTRRLVVIIGLGSSFAFGRCGHCVRCRTRRAGGRLTGDDTVSDQAVT